MLKWIFIMSALFMSILGWSQAEYPLLETGKYWEIQVNEGGSICQFTSGDRWWVEGDSMVNGQLYWKTWRYPIKSSLGDPYCPPYYVDGSERYPGPLLREEFPTGKIFLWDQEEEHVLFDYQLVQGDTFSQPYTTSGEYLIIDSIGRVLDQTGVERKVWYFDNGAYFMDGVGGSMGLFYPLVEGIGSFSRLQCVKKDAVHIWGGQCFETSAVQEPSNSPFLIKGNVIVDRIEVEVTEDCKSAAVFDITGRTWTMVDNPGRNFSLDVSLLPPGSYWVHLFFDENSRMQYFLKL